MPRLPVLLSTSENLGIVISMKIVRHNDCDKAAMIG